MRSLLLAMLVALGMYFPSAEFVPNPRLSGFEGPELVRLARGEVIVGLDRWSNTHKVRVLGAILIDSPARHIWDVMIDCDRAPEFVPRLRNCRVLYQSGNTEIIEHRVALSALLPAVTYTFRAHYQDLQRVDFTMVSGDLREFEGSWTLEQVNDGQQTIVVYSVYLDPGFLVPQWLVRRALRGELPDLLIALRNGVWESRLASRCASYFFTPGHDSPLMIQYAAHWTLGHARWAYPASASSKTSM